jgi:hypothetical protein
MFQHVILYQGCPPVECEQLLQHHLLAVVEVVQQQLILVTDHQQPLTLTAHRQRLQQHSNLLLLLLLYRAGGTGILLLVLASVGGAAAVTCCNEQVVGCREICDAAADVATWHLQQEEGDRRLLFRVCLVSAAVAAAAAAPGSPFADSQCLYQVTQSDISFIAAFAGACGTPLVEHEVSQLTLSSGPHLHCQPCNVVQIAAAHVAVL